MKTQVTLCLFVSCLLLAPGCASDGRRTLTPEEVMASPEARLRSIILTDVQLQNVTLGEALRYLTEQSRTADPDKVGVTITLRQFDVQEMLTRINLRLPQATVMQALDAVCRQTGYGYLLEKENVVVLPYDSLQSLQHRTRSFSSPRGW